MDLKFPRIRTLHQLVRNLESKSPGLESLKLREGPDLELTGSLRVFANDEHEKELVLDGVEDLFKRNFVDDAKSKLLDVLNDSSFYRGFPELATYGWLERHSMWFNPQIKVDHPDVLNPNGSTLDGVLALYNTAFDIKSFGLGAYLANKLIEDLAQKFNLSRVGIEGPMDVDPKTVETDALGQQSAIARELHAHREFKIPSLSWTIRVMPPRPVSMSVRTWEPYKQAEELQFYPFKQAAQFTTKQPFMLIFSYLARLNPFSREESNGFNERFFRSLARRAFIGLSNSPGPLRDLDSRVTNRTLGYASRLLSSLMFVDLETERYHVFFNPRATNPISGGIENFIHNSHPTTDLASYDDFKYDSY
jgi:hypothetical protein